MTKTELINLKNSFTYVRPNYITFHPEKEKQLIGFDLSNFDELYEDSCRKLHDGDTFICINDWYEDYLKDIFSDDERYSDIDAIFYNQADFDCDINEVIEIFQ